MTLVEEIERYDIYSQLIESIKKIIINLIVMFKNIHKIQDYKYHIQNIRLLSMEMTDIFNCLKRIDRMDLRRLEDDEINYAAVQLDNFGNMIFHNFR